MRSTLCLIVVLILAAPLFAGAKGFSTAIQGLTAHDFPTIRLLIRVFTPEPVTLSADHFKLFEKKEPITEFSVELVDQEPFVVLLLDRSSSMEPVIQQVKQSALGFAMPTAKKARIAVLTFASDVDVAQDFTRDPNALKTAVTKFRPWGGTALYDGLHRSCEMLAAKGGNADLKTIVCLTDGKDESPRGEPGFSIKKPLDVVNLAKRYGIRIIFVGLGTNLDETFMKDLSRETGGSYLHAPSAAQLASIFQAITRRLMLERFYRMSYSTPFPKRDGTRRELTIHSQAKGRTDQGTGSYVAPKDDGGRETARTGQPAQADQTSPDKGRSGMKLEPPQIGRPGTIDHLSSPDIGRPGQIDHLSKQKLPGIRPPEIGNLPGMKGVQQDLDKMYEDLNTGNQELYDQGMDEGNQAIDSANDNSEKAFRQGQEGADAGIAEGNQGIDDANETSGSSHDQSQDTIDATYDQINDQLQDLGINSD